MKDFRESLKEEMKNPEFKKEWDALEEEFNAIRLNLKAGNSRRRLLKRSKQRKYFSASYPRG